jgi:hypothetical protein
VARVLALVDFNSHLRALLNLRHSIAHGAGFQEAPRRIRPKELSIVHVGETGRQALRVPASRSAVTTKACKWV